MPREKATTFQFVNLRQDAPSLAADQRRSVRSHAMLKFMREQREKRQQDHPEKTPTTTRSSSRSSSSSASSSPVEEEPADETIIRTHHVSIQTSFGDRIAINHGGYQDMVPSPLKTTIDGDRPDPFDTMCLPLEPHMERAVKFANYLFPRILCPSWILEAHPGAVSEHWPILRMAVTDRGMLHSLVALSMFFLVEKYDDKEMITQALSHRGQGLGLVRASLMNPDKCRSIEEVIISITWLLPIEVFLNDAKAHQAHTSAICKLVREAGGLQNLGAIRHWIIEADHRSSTILDLKPGFTFEQLSIPLSCTRYLKLPKINDSSIYELMAEIQRLQNFVERNIMHAVRIEKTGHYKTFLDIRSLIHHTLLSLKDKCTSGITICLRYALLIYVNMVFRTEFPSSSIWIANAKRLRGHLSSVDRNTFMHREDELLWILCTSALRLDKADTELRKWYVGAAGALCHAYGFETWESVLKQIGSVLTPPSWLMKDLKLFWTELEMTTELMHTTRITDMSMEKSLDFSLLNAKELVKEDKIKQEEG